MDRNRPLVLVSNRGPVSFDLDAGGTPRARRGAGGLISGLGPLVRDTDAIWIAAAMTDGDRALAGALTDAEGFRVLLLASPPDEFTLHYDAVCNTALWFTHHGLFDPVREPAWPGGWVETAWAAHRRVNDRFAAAVIDAAPADAVVLVQDYHLCLVAEAVRAARPDLTLVHFSHTPFAPPVWLRMLPATARRELLAGLAAHHACGFHSPRWEADFLASAAAVGVDAPATFVSPLGPDPDDLAATAASPDFAEAFAAIDGRTGDRRLLVRVDRIELSKNLARGFDAYDLLLARRRDLRERVVFAAHVYPSRAGVAAYDAHRREVEDRVRAINERWATEGWMPIAWDGDDHYPTSMAALARADVVLVNPIRDGLNLVAKEAVILNHRDAQLVLSPEAGAWDELGDHAWRAEPFDVGQTADALAAALDAPPPEAATRHAALRAAALARTPADWLQDQLAAAR